MNWIRNGSSWIAIRSSTPRSHLFPSRMKPNCDRPFPNYHDHLHGPFYASQHEIKFFSTLTNLSSFQLPWSRSLTHLSLLASFACGSLFFTWQYIRSLDDDHSEKAELDSFSINKNVSSNRVKVNSPFFDHPIEPNSIYLFGHLGRFRNQPKSIEPLRIPLPSPFKLIALSDHDEILAIDNRGKLFSIHPPSSPHSSSSHIEPLLSNLSFSHIACGKDGFSLALQTNGSVWYRRSFQHNFIAISPSLHLGQKITKVAVGSAHAILLTNQNKIFAFGSNSHGQCGNPDLKMESFPTQHPKTSSPLFAISTPSPVVDIAAGLLHTIIITDQNQLNSLGYNKYLQLGCEQTWKSPFDMPPYQIFTFGTYKDQHQLRQNIEKQRAQWVDRVYRYRASVEEYSSSNAQYLTLEDRDPSLINLYAHYKMMEIPFFLKNPEIQIEKIYCGDHFTLVLDDQQSLFGFGAGNLGQLGRSTPKTYNYPFRMRQWPLGPELSKDGELTEGEMEKVNHFSGKMEKKETCDQLSCGSSHCLALSNLNQIFSWGWNSKGECVTGDRAIRNIPTLILENHTVPIKAIDCHGSTSAILV